MNASAPPLSLALDPAALVNLRRPGRGYRLAYVSIPILLRHVLTIAIKDTFRTAPPRVFKPQDFRQPFLGTDEIASLNRYKALKKQVEWMAGRYAAKQLARCYLDTPQICPRTRVAYREKGAPFFTGFPSLSLSISHAGDYAVAGVGLAPSFKLGLDLELIRPESRTTLQQTAFSDREREFLAQQDDEAFFRHWTAKEAYLKYIGLGFHESLKNIEILDGTIFHDRQAIPSLSLLSHRPFPRYAFTMVF